MPQTITPCGGSASGAYKSAVLNSGPRGYWKHDELSAVGTYPMLDSSGYGRHGYYNGSAFMTFGQPPLADGTSIIYSAAHNTRGELDNSTPGGGPLAIVSPDWTVEAWIKTTQVPAAICAYIVCSADAGFDDWLAFRITPAGVMQLFAYDTTFASTIKTGSVVVNDGVKHYIAGTFGSDDTVRIYVDGVQDGASVAGPAAHSTTVNKITFGDRYHGADDGFYDGTLDEVAIYPYALTPAQIALHYASV